MEKYITNPDNGNAVHYLGYFTVFGHLMYVLNTSDEDSTDVLALLSANLRRGTKRYAEVEVVVEKLS